MSTSTNKTKPQLPAQTIHWLNVGSVSDIPQRGARKLIVNNSAIAVFRTASDDIYAIEDKCPHAGGPLSQGIVHGDCVTCPLHNWNISLRTGKALGTDEGKTRQFPVRLEDDCIQVGIAVEPTDIDGVLEVADA